MSETAPIEYCTCIPGFCHLHAHSTNSRLDGMITQEEYVEHCLTSSGLCPSCGKPYPIMSAGAITDHGIMSGSLEFYTLGKKKGFNAILGQEIYLVADHTDPKSERFHEGVLAMNWEGYQNLVWLSSVGFTEGLQRNYFACIDDEQIESHSSGLILLSGCISSRLARTIMGGYRERETLMGLIERVRRFEADPSAMLEERRKAQRIASHAIQANGVKKNRLLAESQALHAQLDEINGVIGAGVVGEYVGNLQVRADAAFHSGWVAGKAIVERRKEVFGDRYYLETQIVPLEDQQIYNGFVRTLAAEYDIPTVVTADAHYLKKGDADLHRQMLRIRTDKKQKDTGEPKKIVKIEFKDPSQAEAVKKSSGTPEELGDLYDAIMLDEAMCIGKQPKTHTKKYAGERDKWVKNATLYYLQNAGETLDEPADADVGEDGLVSVDAIDPGRPFSEWLPEFYVRTPVEMIEAGAVREEMENTLRLAARVDIQIPVNDDNTRIVHMPSFELPALTHPDTGQTVTFDYDGYLAYLCAEGLRQYLDQHLELNPVKYHNRLDYELRVIGEAGFSSYFLIVWDYINAIRENGGLTGPGRGSAAASLVTFLLGITKVIDPLKYPDLMFERFLTPGRPDLPDIDTDIDFDSASWVFGYCGDRYGHKKVAKIGTFSVIGVKQALQDIGRVLGVDFMDVQKAAKFFSEWRPEDDDVVDDNKAMFDLEDVTEREPELKTLRDKCDLNKQWFAYANKLVGKRRNVSQHASGVAIASSDLLELGIPLLASFPKGDKMVIATQYDMDDMAKLGVPKFDQLKLSSLNTIAESERLIGSDFSIEDIPLDDPPTYAALSKGDNLGIFQLAQSKLKSVLRAVRPQNLSDLAAVITIIRPGLFAKDEETGMTMEELYKARRQGSVPVRYLFPFLEPITKDSQGVMIYQEQVLKVLWESGMTPLEADKLRKFLSKKLMSKAKEFEPAFVSGISAKHGLTTQEAEALWALIVEFAAYGFNAAHAYSYGLISYWTSYLKTHYPGQFMAASLTVQSQKTSKAAKELIPKLLEDCGQMGRSLQILPPSVNRSQKGFVIEMTESPGGLVESIRFGLGGISGVASLADHIIAERMNGEYVDFEDFDRRLKERTGKRPNKTALVNLALAGALDDFFSHRSKALWAIECAREDVKYKRVALEEAGWTAEKASILSQRQAELCGSYYFVRDNLEVLGTTEVDNFFDRTIKDRVKIGGRVIDVKLDRTTKKGSKYHRATIKTQWGDVTADFYAGWRDDAVTYLNAIKGKLFDGSVVIVHGDKRDETSMFGKGITLPPKQFQGQQREDPKAIAKEAEHLLQTA